LIFDKYQKNVMGNLINTILLVILIGIVFLMANKFQFFLMIFVHFTATALLKKKQSIKKLIIIGALGIAIFAVMYNVIYVKMYSFSVSDSIYWYQLRIPDKLSFLANPYLYVANNFENLYHFMETSPQKTLGYKGLYNITRNYDICNFIYPAKIAVHYSDFTESLHMGAMNTGSIFLNPYHDFGYGGIIVYAAFCGMICCQIENRVVRKRNFGTFFAYCYCIISVFLSFFADCFLRKNMLINLFAGIVV
jgi:oligosaccharide repeat unit polymerase